MIEHIEINIIVKVFEKHGVELIDINGLYKYYDEEAYDYKSVFVDGNNPIESFCQILDISRETFNKTVEELSK